MTTSPFPGMDPYLERFWGDVHQRLVTYACDALQSRLPSDLRARMQERVYLEIGQPEAPRQVYYPDVGVVERPGRRSEEAGGVAVAIEVDVEVEVAEPIHVEIPHDPVRETFIEVIDVKSGRKVVTSIEVLSPANKLPGEGQRLYLKKQAEMRNAGVNLVEIDLLRRGERVLVARPEWLPPACRATYLTSVWRAARPERVEVYPMPLSRRLPIIKIPLRPTDADITLDLQALVDQSYRNGGYDDIDYQASAEPPLAAEDAAFAVEVLRRPPAP